METGTEVNTPVADDDKEHENPMDFGSDFGDPSLTAQLLFQSDVALWEMDSIVVILMPFNHFGPKKVCFYFILFEHTFYIDILILH